MFIWNSVNQMKDKRSIIEEYLNIYPKSLNGYECIQEIFTKKEEFIFKMKPKKLTTNEFVIVKRISLSDDRDYEKLEKEVCSLFFSKFELILLFN